MENTAENNTASPTEGCEVRSYLSCLVLAIIYVSSLYVWKTKEDRKHPSTIKKRFLSVTVVTLVSPFFVYHFMDKSLLADNSLWTILGIRFAGLATAIVVPMVLTAILFLGPISILYFNGFFPFYTEYKRWPLYMKDLIFIRNYIMAPISEEFTFRSCMLALIIHCVEPKKAIFICPIFFGTAHLHHMREQIREGIPVVNVLISAGFQFGYTSIFGAYSAYLFLRTGHLIAPILVHSFCNHMGVPDFGAVMELPPRQKIVSIVCFITGLVLWILLVRAMTEPSLYSNDLPWANKIHYDDQVLQLEPEVA